MILFCRIDQTLHIALNSITQCFNLKLKNNSLQLRTFKTIFYNKSYRFHHLK